MQTTLVQSIKLALVKITGLPKDTLHVYIGLIIFFVVMNFVKEKSRLGFLPILSVLIAAIFGEILDMRDDLSLYGKLRWVSSIRDIINTAFWPVIIFSVGRYSNIYSSFFNSKKTN